ncbi:MAG TPA: sugar phosphate nucleotidyltransferase [Gaiellales bacterium]|nr:sugar phosphate nucleotidyltransferase [Gaiellales bacterium]
MRHALLLAGGSGTRLWPWSTAALPKQLVPLFGGRSLLELAVTRARAVLPAEQVWVGAGEPLRAALTVGAVVDASRLVVEPAPRDTLPAIALGCAVIAAGDPEATVAVLTTDQLIEPVERFGAALESAFGVAETEPAALVCFGVPPDHAATGYGYLELGEPLPDRAPAGAPSGSPRRVSMFREKPPRELAQTYLDAGPQRYLWNAGMFVWRASTLLDAVAQFAPATAEVVRRLAPRYGRPDYPQLAAELWPTVERRSIDYGVLEPASRSAAFTIAAVALDARWLDVGSWPAYADAVGRDSDANAAHGRALLLDSTGCLAASSDPEHLVALVGCRDLVVVHTPGATLVCPADRAQEVKELQARVAREAPDRA